MTDTTYVRKSAQAHDFLTPIVELVTQTPVTDLPDLSSSVPFYSLSTVARKQGYEYYSIKTRYFVLRQDHIAYYASEKDAQKNKAPKGVISLTLFTTCFRCEMNDARQEDSLGYAKIVNGIVQAGLVELPNGLRIRVPECNRTYYIFFQSREEREQWRFAVCFNIDRLRQADLEFPRKALTKLMPFASQLGSTLSVLKLALRYRQFPKPSLGDSSPMARALQSIRSADWGGFRNIMEEFDVDVNETVTGGGTYLTAMMGNKDCAQHLRWFLESYSVDVNKVHTLTGDSPLMLAVMANNTSAVQLLLEFGADRSLPNKYGETVTSECLNPDVSSILQTYFPPIRFTGNQGKRSPSTSSIAREPDIGPGNHSPVVPTVTTNPFIAQPVMQRYKPQQTVYVAGPPMQPSNAGKPE